MNVYEIITQKILDQLACGVIPWQKPWKGGKEFCPQNLITGHPYRGINLLLTGCQNYSDQRWITFKQLQKIQGRIKAKETPTPIVYWLITESKNVDPKTAKARKIFSPRYYDVWNVAQCELPSKFSSPLKASKLDPIEEAENLIGGYSKGPTIKEGFGHAGYRASLDVVEMPYRGQFGIIQNYYGVLFHELTHSTGHETRLQREGVTEFHQFGDEIYSKEELIAEMGAAMLCGFAGIELATLSQSASYIKGWLNVLKADSKAVIQAAARAQKAVDHILGVKPFGEEGEGA